MRKLIFLAFLFALVPTPLFAVAPGIFSLPSEGFYLFELAPELLCNAQLQQKLALSATQLAKLKTYLESDEFTRMHDQAVNTRSNFLRPFGRPDS